MNRWSAAFLAAAMCSASAQAQTDEAFYRSNGMTIIVGHSPGGIYDVQARLLSRHIGRFMPGAPNVIVQNMPGAGSLKAANYLYALAPKDGSHIGSFANGLIMQQLLDDRGIQFDSRRFGWIGSSMSEISIVYAWHQTKFNSLQDVMREQMVVPGTGSGANSVTYPRILNALLGTKFKVVAGYPGAAEGMLAIERGEADGHAGGTLANLLAARPTWLAEGKVRILAQLGLQPHRDLPAVPLVLDMVSNKTDRDALTIIFAKQSAAFPIAAPPGIPAERLSLLRRAFDATAKDEAFRTEAAKFNIEIDALSGEEVAAVVERIFTSSPAAVERARDLVNAAADAGGR